MKKNFIYATLSAIALVGAVSLTSCSSNEDVADVNPTYDGEAVKTQFTLSLPFGNNATTRQTSAVVQQAEDINSFRGMSGIVLIPFQSATLTERGTRLGANITLGENNILKPTTTNAENAIPSGQLLAGSNAVLYKDVTIPVGTAGFLFYGKATGEDGFANGSLTPSGLTGANPSTDITFTPTSILSKTGKSSNVGAALATYVSQIAAAADASDNTITWAGCAADYSNAPTSAPTWYNAGLGAMYTAFTSMKAGASSYVQAAVQDLYTSIKDNTDLVSKAIKAAILNTYASDANSTGTLTFDNSINGYPADIDMPEGAASLSWNGNTPNVASAVTGSNLGNSGMNVINMSNISYPASLYYYVNSAVKVSDGPRQTDYNTNDNWSTILGKYSTTATAVSSSTRSVAIETPIDYAVGRLDVNVNELNKDKQYYDRRGVEVSPFYLTDPNDASTETPSFQLTGVLIGGQKAVDYKFEPTGSTEFTIYDNTINKVTNNSDLVPVTATATTPTVTYAGPTYTLALQTAQNTKVYVALEFLNKGADFQGFDGVVKHNCRFYMIAQLDPTSTSSNASSGTLNNTGNRVFMQDFKTIASFTFGQGSADANHDGVSDNPGGFANAYTTIPDLRTPKLELGLSVNLQWQTGITFNVTF